MEDEGGCIYLITKIFITPPPQDLANTFEKVTLHHCKAAMMVLLMVGHAMAQAS
jgi:hypothetical protein